MPRYRRPADERELPAPVKAWLTGFIREAREEKLSPQAFEARLYAALSEFHRVAMAEEAERASKTPPPS